jgi:hypothetical protein
VQSIRTRGDFGYEYQYSSWLLLLM